MDEGGKNQIRRSFFSVVLLSLSSLMSLLQWGFFFPRPEEHVKPGHSQNDMLPIILEKVTPKNDEFLRLKREELWIRTYQAVEFGNNKKS